MTTASVFAVVSAAAVVIRFVAVAASVLYLLYSAVAASFQATSAPSASAREEKLNQKASILARNTEKRILCVVVKILKLVGFISP